MIKINSYIGDKIRSFRKSRGLTQEELGEMVALPQPYIGGIERGERNISLDTLQKLLEALDVTPKEAFRDYQNNLISKEMIEAIDRIDLMLLSRSLQEVELIEKLIVGVISTVDGLGEIK
ncbi:helix-turn-helix domain-containing protein [Paenibacillus thiaminolyticus]|uniref:Helix-turn-helix domain-containing protein n=1 Tax=Paenibacillus thiaminolyticus TaxID=49283 RepID=A0AAP9J0U2_PANTH|nr:helix-turn-helix transcriptional regulator [Paenibacillus thiaminolyticus]MCY9534636.1 helix-turn-helix domain-containing protein [Paenibacillus thiaminolyticus]MCY9603407.1 helix-turn-helix domain-containing protein [Paenibacillus thiaminolyticus]MCY9611013.1 helix-turn-helix domain-containing protein [Paenibacillus thiaminolyticus]MCY9616646.1 helix-turn-helix domain-containing protein [Paenibacillus thiaminolyticus]MCY9622030.1 helix-turn-helix domain-containing protein [Paenibacillus th